MSIVKAQPHDRRAYESARRSEAEDRLYRRPAPARASGDAPPCEPERAQDGANVAAPAPPLLFMRATFCESMRREEYQG